MSNADGARLLNELTLFYSPSETKQHIESPLPLMGLLDNMFNFFSHSFGQVMGFTIQDEEGMQKNVPAKYFMKAFPVVKVAADCTAMFGNTFRKEFNS